MMHGAHCPVDFTPAQESVCGFHTQGCKSLGRPKEAGAEGVGGSGAEGRHVSAVEILAWRWWEDDYRYISAEGGDDRAVVRRER